MASDLKGPFHIFIFFADFKFNLFCHAVLLVVNIT